MKKSAYSVLAILVVLFSFFFSANAFAQENDEASEFVKQARTMADNFGGVRFGVDLMLGTGRCDDYAFCMGHDEEVNSESYSIAGLINFEVGYLWGSRVFMGPTVTFSAGFPMLISGAINYRLLVPANDQDAFSFSAGFGMSWHVGFYDSDYNEDHEVNYMYVPISLGFEHVFDNGFTLGATAQLNIAFDRSSKDVVVKNADGTPKLDENGYQVSDIEYSTAAVLGTFGIGIHLGYKW